MRTSPAKSANRTQTKWQREAMKKRGVGWFLDNIQQVRTLFFSIFSVHKSLVLGFTSDSLIYGRDIVFGECQCIKSGYAKLGCFSPFPISNRRIAPSLMCWRDFPSCTE